MTSSHYSLLKSQEMTNHAMVANQNGSQTTLGESGISSKGSSMLDEYGSATAPSSSAPSTPHVLCRSKPPPKPPRIRSYVGRSSYNDHKSPSPSVRSPGVESLKSSLADVTDTLDASVHSPDGSVHMKQHPLVLKSKVCQILAQTRDILVCEMNPENILSYLQEKGVITACTERELRRSTSKQTMCELLLDIITSKGHAEFKVFCDALRYVEHQDYLADLLYVLDSLIETMTVSNGHPLRPDVQDMSSSGTEETSSAHRENYCHQCNCNNNNLETNEMLSECTSFDIDISYFDIVTGENKAVEDVAEIKITRPVTPHNLDRSFSFQVEDADRYIPVISVGLYNQCLCGGAMDSLARILERFTCVRELSIAKSHIDTAGIRRLGKALQRNHSLVKLDLRLNTIGDDGAAFLADGLRQNTTLRTLNVTSTGLSGPGCSRLLSGLMRNPSLTDLDVGFNDLREVGCRAMAELLASNSNLRKLRMRDNNILDRGPRHLFKSLQKNSRLSVLDLSSNRMGNINMGNMSEMLLYNRTLRELNLENCNISKEGCIALARALRTNTVLKILDLSMNPIKDDGVEFLSDGLKYNQVLDTLCLNMCMVGNRGFLRVLDALRYNTTMTTLKLCYNDIGRTEAPCPSTGGSSSAQDDLVPTIEVVYDQLCQILQFNKNLKVLLWGNKLDEPVDAPPQ